MTATVETRTALSVPCPLSKCGATVGQGCRTTTDGLAPLGQPREPHRIRVAAEILASPELQECEACNAEPGEPCRPGCLGYALAMGEL